MSLIGARIRNGQMNKIRAKEWMRVESRDELTTKFAMMMRCSYS